MSRSKAYLLVFIVSLSFVPLKALSLPDQIVPLGERVIIVDPREHRWGAYMPDGRLVRSGICSCGKEWCDDIQRPCTTHVGHFRIRSLGGSECKSPSFPIPHGGAPMPYCMYYTYAQALHGSYEVGEAHLSHGCVRLRVSDAKWLRYHFASIGTLVIIESY